MRAANKSGELPADVRRTSGRWLPDVRRMFLRQEKEKRNPSLTYPGILLSYPQRGDLIGEYSILKELLESNDPKVGERQK